MDNADRADQTETFLKNSLIEKIRKSVENKPKPTYEGKCLSCREPLSSGKRFCDADCNEDFQKLGKG